MGMSPRMKAKKGRFGAAGLPPTIKITSHVNGDAESSGVTFTMTAVATDPENGDVSAAIAWTAVDRGAANSGTAGFDVTTGPTVQVTFSAANDTWDILATIVDGSIIVIDEVAFAAVLA